MRAQILFVEPADYAIVHLIDLGDRERIKREELFQLPHKLRNTPALAQNVALAGIKIKQNCPMMTCDKELI